MRLKHLNLQGFKTFANKTDFWFTTGITAIVGPNGSGKSNVADAIRWVLGEQSFGSLRAKRTDDMIFSGSDARARAGMAQASITLDNSDGWLPIDFGEVTIGRRAYRDSQNEYLLNGSRVRLRDINQLLSQSGLGRRTYTVIGQGLVDAALSLRADERRALFEEAAGISHYQSKRADALRKLEETDHNLERVYDILTEIKPRLNRLARQAERAREHIETSKHLEQLLYTWYGYRWGQALNALDQARKTAEQRKKEHKQRQNTLRELSERIDQLRQQQNDLRGELGNWRRQSSQLYRQAEKVQRESAVLVERRRMLQTQLEENRSELGPLQARHVVQGERIAQAQTELQKAKQSLIQQQQTVQNAQTDLTARQAERQKCQRELAQTQKQINGLQAGLVKRRSQLESLAERASQLEQQKAKQQREIGQFEAKLSTQNELVAQVKVKLEQLEAKISQAGELKEQLENEQRQVAQRLVEANENLHKIRQDETKIQARLDMLEQLRQDFAIYGKATRSILNAKLPGVLGVLAQLVQVPSELNAAVEAALGADAAAIVVRDWQTAQNVLEHLRTLGVAGRITLLPLSDENRDQEQNAGPPADSLAAKVQSEQAYPLLERLLGSARLVPDLTLVNRQTSSVARYVTPQGDLLRPEGAIEGGQQAESTSPLAQEQEWSRLQARRVELGAQREQLQMRVEQIEQQHRNLEAQISKQAITLDDLQAQYNAQTRQLDAATHQVERLDQQVAWRQQQRAEAKAELAKLAQRQTELETSIQVSSQSQDKLRTSLTQLNEKLQALPINALNEQLAKAQTTVAVAQQSHKSQEQLLRGLKATLDQIVEQRRNRQQRIADLERENAQVAQRIERLEANQTKLNAQLSTLTEQIKPAEHQLEQLEQEHSQTEKKERQAQKRLHEFESHLTTAQLQAARREDELERLRSRIEDELGLVELEMGAGIPGQTLLPLRPLVSQLPVVPQLPPGLEDEIKRLRSQLRRLGSINPDAPAEYEELLQRNTFLNEQLADLKQAGERLQQIINELDALIEKAFRQTFETIAVNFKQMFSTLFGGGSARLSLTNPDELTQTGIEIIARPPGKRQQSLALLSGGERALTACALIFAILKTSPTPFCILDEVDAMLDEANVGRFRQMLDKLAQQTQFIVITHNRGTITAADTIYGISMRADSVSQAVSLRLNGEEIDLAEKA